MSADFFIQWKGTTVCGDFHCVCGSHEHACGTEFMYAIHCTKCGRYYQVPNTLDLVEVEKPKHHAIVNLPATDDELRSEAALDAVREMLDAGARITSIRMAPLSDDTPITFQVRPSDG